MRHSFGNLVTVLLVMVAGWWGIRLYLGSKFPPAQVQKGFSQSLGVPMKVGSVYLDWFGSLTMENVEISDPDGRRTATIRRANYDFSLSTLLGGKLRATGLRLDDVLVTLDPTRIQAFRRLPAGKGRDRDYPITLEKGSVEIYEDAGLTRKISGVSSLRGLLSPSLAGKWNLDLQNTSEFLRVRRDPDGVEGELKTAELDGKLQASQEANGRYRLSGTARSASLGAMAWDLEIERLEEKGKAVWQVVKASFTSSGGTIEASGVWPRLSVMTRGYELPARGTTKPGLLAGRLEMSGTDLPSKFSLQGTLSGAAIGEQKWKSVPIKATADGTVAGRLTVRQFQVGEVTGEAWVEPAGALKGELVLDRPLELASMAASSSGMAGMLSSRLTSMKISGVKLAGTLASPVVNPVWVVQKN